ncbi:MAG: LysR substrate-binding domain-containing protein [Paracoccaceae bacterium]|nr:LysR substrate-binding domain-containing protein [Paracoccaceae bacterium]
MVLRLRQLQAFETVAQTGSVTQAAANLGISQPAVSRLLSSFSKEISFNLFIRKHGQLLPTQEAKLLLGEISRVLEGLKNIEELQHNLTERTAGHLRIACLPGLAISHLPNVIMDFLKTRPSVTVTIEPDRPERILDWIIGEQYDCGLTDGFPNHPAIQSSNFQIRTVCIFPKGHWLSDKTEIWPEDLVKEKLIHTRRDSPFFNALNQAFIDKSVKLSSWIETRQFTGACALVSQGCGVSVVSELDASQFIGQGVEMRPFLPQVPHYLSVVRPTAAPPSIITLEFIEVFSESLKLFTIPN